MLLWVWLQFELVCNDLRNTVLMLPPSLSHCSLGGEDQGRDGKYCGGDLLGNGDDEV